VVPAPLGSTARQSRPAASAAAASTCAGRSTAKPRTSRAIWRSRAPVSSLPSTSPAVASRRKERPRHIEDSMIASPGRIGLIARAAFVLVLFEHKMIT